MKTSYSRRSVLKLSAAALAGVGALIHSGRAFAAKAIPKVSDNEKYEYNADASKAPRKPKKVGKVSYPAKDQYCENCTLKLKPNSDGTLGCALFPGKSVEKKGWCNMWTPGPDAVKKK